MSVLDRLLYFASNERGRNRSRQIVRSNAEAQTAGYQPHAYVWGNQIKDLPAFNHIYARAMLQDPTVTLALAMRSAPIYSLQFAYKNEDGEWTEGVEAENEAVGEYVHRQLKHIWQSGIAHILSSQEWGWSGAEVLLKTTRFGFVGVDRLLGRAARDVQLRTLEHNRIGISVKNVKSKGEVRLYFPNCFFSTFHRAPGEWYGAPVTKGAFSPWFDKWMNGGALGVRRLFMHKDAYGGASLRYPSGTTALGNSDGSVKVVPNQNLAREMVEQLTSGGVVCMPSETNDSGKELWQLERAEIPANPVHILQYPKDLDIEMMRGFGIPDDLFVEQGSGAWRGRSITLEAFYSGLDRWVISIFNELKEQVLDTLVELNFGKDQWYEIQHKPLGEQAMERQGETTPDVPQAPTVSLPAASGQAANAINFQQPDDEGFADDGTGFFSINSRFFAQEGDSRVNSAGNRETLTKGRWRLANPKDADGKDKPAADKPTSAKQRKDKPATTTKTKTMSPSQPPGSQIAVDVKKRMRAIGMVKSFPPADVPLEDIEISTGTADELKFKPLMKWKQRTQSGRISSQYRYTQAFHDRNADHKFAVINAIAPHSDKIAESLKAKMTKGKPRDREAAAIASTIHETGLRPTDGTESIAHGHFGIASLQKRHVTIQGDAVHLDFIGKEGIRNQTTVLDPANAKFLRDAFENAGGGNDFIFKAANSNHANAVLKKTSVEVGGPNDISVKDLRTLKATVVAEDIVKNYNGPPPPLTGDPKKDARTIAKAILEMSDEVAKVLNNTATQARDNYIHPRIFREWQQKLAAGN